MVFFFFSKFFSSDHLPAARVQVPSVEGQEQGVFLVEWFGDEFGEAVEEDGEDGVQAGCSNGFGHVILMRNHFQSLVLSLKSQNR